MNKYLRSAFFILVVLAVVLIAGFLRLQAASQLPVDFDEDDYLRAAQQFASLIRAHDWKGFLDTNYRPEHPPLAKIIFGVSILSYPNEPLIPDRPTSASQDQTLPKEMLLSARVSSAIFGTLESLLMGIINPLAGLLLAVHSFTIYYTSEVMLEAVPAFTSLAAVICYTRYKRQKAKDPGYRGFSGWLIGSALFLGLTAASKYLYCVVGIAILVDWALSIRSDRMHNKVVLLFLWGILSLVFFFAADPYLWPAPIERLKGSLLYSVVYSSGAVEVESAGFPFWQPLVWLAQSVPWSQQVFVVLLDFPITILAIIGLSRLWRKERVYVIWLATALLFLLVWNTKWPQYILLLTAPLAFSASEGFMRWVFEPAKSVLTRKRVARKARRFSLRELSRISPWMLPGAITLGVLILFPLVYQLAMSLTDFTAQSIKDGINGGIWREVWRGLFVHLISPAVSAGRSGLNQFVHYIGFSQLKPILVGAYDFSAVLVFEIVWTVLSIILQATLGIGLALILNQRGIRFPNLWRTIFLLPWAIPEFVGALFWLRTFDPTVGWISQAVGTSGGSGGSLLISNILNSGGPNLMLIFMLIAATWIGFPFIMLATSASLKLIPFEVYDAAAMDGAGRWSTFRYITWPLLLPLIVPVIMIRSIQAFNQFYLFYVFSPRINLFGTFSYFSYYIFSNGGYAYSAAINVATVVILILIILVFNRWTKASEGVTYA